MSEGKVPYAVKPVPVEAAKAGLGEMDRTLSDLNGRTNKLAGLVEELDVRVRPVLEQIEGHAADIPMGWETNTPLAGAFQEGLHELSHVMARLENIISRINI